MAVKNNEIETYYDAPLNVQNAIKTLRSNIKFASIDRDIKTIVLTSVLPSEGKTTISIQLAISMAESGLRTIVVNTDCYKPFYSRKLGVQNKKTWLDALYDEQSLEEAITGTSVENLFFLESDTKVANPVELVGSNRFYKMVGLLRASFDVIIFDTPPLGTFIEAAILASKSDGTILVVDSGGVDEKKAQDVVEQLNRANAQILGVVLNNVATSDDEYYGYYYYRAQQERGGKNARKRRKPSSKKRSSK